jgi:hypothetical protein
MLCFAFSWVVNDLGIEQFVFNHIGCPEFKAVSPILHPLIAGLATPWIHYSDDNAYHNRSKSSSIRILLKGDTSLHSIQDYLIGGNVTCEYDDMASLSAADPLSQVTVLLPTKLYTERFHVIIFSLMQYNFDSWEDGSDTLLPELFGTLDSLCGDTPGNPLLVILLGSEIPFEAGSDSDKKLAELHAELRPIIEDYALAQSRIRTINITDYIHDQSDFDNSVNRFSVRVYSDIVEQIVIHINEKINEIIASRQ